MPNISTRNIRVAFTKLGPLLRLDAVEVRDFAETDAKRSVGEIWIREDLHFANVCIAVPHFPSQEITAQLQKHAFAWCDAAEHAYREKHCGETVVFQSNR